MIKKKEPNEGWQKLQREGKQMKENEEESAGKMKECQERSDSKKTEKRGNRPDTVQKLWN